MCPEIAQLCWTDDSKPNISAIDGASWEQKATNSRTNRGPRPELRGSLTSSSTTSMASDPRTLPVTAGRTASQAVAEYMVLWTRTASRGVFGFRFFWGLRLNGVSGRVSFVAREMRSCRQNNIHTDANVVVFCVPRRTQDTRPTPKP